MQWRRTSAGSPLPAWSREWRRVPHPRSSQVIVNWHRSWTLAGMLFTPLILAAGLSFAPPEVGAQQAAQQQAAQQQQAAPQDVATPAEPQPEKPRDPGNQKAEEKKPPTPAHTGFHALFGDLVE